MLDCRAEFTRVMTGQEIFEVCKSQVYEAWRRSRSQPHGDDLVAFLFLSAPGEVQIVIAPRESLIAQLTTEGVDFTKYPEIQCRASERTPIPAFGIWVIVGVDDGAGERSISVMKFIEPLFGRLGGGAAVGQA